jgi:hypothetical protein
VWARQACRMAWQPHTIAGMPRDDGRVPAPLTSVRSGDMRRREYYVRAEPCRWISSAGVRSAWRIASRFR